MKMDQKASPPVTALVLSGGGARGAYEAGVALYVADELSLPSGREGGFDILSGTSSGALNCSYLAAHRGSSAAQGLAHYWRHLTPERVFRFGLPELTSLARKLWGQTSNHHSSPVGEGYPHAPIAGLLDTTPLRKDITDLIEWDQIGSHLAADRLTGLALCATEVCRGRTAIFYQMAQGREIVPAEDPSKVIKRVEVGPDHALASAAVPFLFPAVQVEGTCYVDGGLRQNTPIYPAMRMGADRLLVVSVSESPAVSFARARSSCKINSTPGVFFLLGRTIKSLLNEAIDYELHRIEMFNELLIQGQKLYGEEYLEKINDVTASFRHSRYRQISTCLVRPSRDLEEMARAAYNEAPDEMVPSGIGGALLRKRAAEQLIESELLSYLMFTPRYLSRLVELGFEDARAMRGEIIRVFS